jgi:two-component system, NtrC family, sensor kinase
VVVSRDDAALSPLLLTLARRITARHDLDDVLAETFRCLRPLVPFGGGSIQLVDDEGWIQMAAADPAAPDYVMAHRVPLGGSVAGRVILTEQPTYLSDLETDEPRSRRAISTGVRSYFAVPLIADGQAIGVLQVDSATPSAWTDGQRIIFVSVAPVVAAAIQNARAHARAASARIQARSADRKLAEARALTTTIRACLEAGDAAALDRQLQRLEGLLGEVADVRRLGYRLPEPRLAVS